MKTILITFVGKEPYRGSPNEPFRLGTLEVIQSPMKASKQSIGLSLQPEEYDNIIVISGSFFVTRLLEIGIVPGTSFIAVALSDVIADQLIEKSLEFERRIDQFMVTDLNYEMFAELLRKASDRADIHACKLEDSVKDAYFSYFDIDPETLDSEAKVTLRAESSRGEIGVVSMVPAKNLESLMLAAAQFQEMAETLNVVGYRLKVFLHPINAEGQIGLETLYEYEKKAKISETDGITD